MMRPRYKWKAIVCLYVLFILILNSTGCNKIKTYTKKIEDNRMEEAKMIQEAQVMRNEHFPEVDGTIPGVKEEMISYEYWTSRLSDGKKIIMNINEIKCYNDKLSNKGRKIYNLESYCDSISKSQLASYIKQYKLPDKQMYDDKGNILKADFFNSLIKNLNLEGIKDENKVKYAISVKKLSIRSFPTEVGAYDSTDSKAFDRFQESGCEPCEAVLILHESKDQKWYFIQTYNYRGWIKAEEIAIEEDKKRVFDYINSENFLIVTGNHVNINEIIKNSNEACEVFNMGNKLPLINGGELYKKYNKKYYIVKLPFRKADGSLEFYESLIGKLNDVVEGYLPYTRENILKQAFKLQGDKYDWGNKYDGRDCSSFIACVYKTFGLLMPRNTDAQENSIGIKYDFAQADSIEKRNEILDKVKPGAAIYMPGHVTMYIGKVDGVHYMIHDFAAYGKREGSKYIYTPVFSVQVTSTILTVTSGTPYIEKFTSVLQFEN